MAVKDLTTVEPKLLKVMAHKTRRKILQALSAGPKSPKMIADEIDEPLGNVSYHMHFLHNNKAVVLVSTEPRRGALEHFYNLTPVGESLLDSGTIRVEMRHGDEVIMTQTNSLAEDPDTRRILLPDGSYLYIYVE